MLGSMTARPSTQQAEEVSDQFKEFMKHAKVQNASVIRPKKMNVKEFLRLCEEIYSFRFDHKSVKGLPKNAQAPQSLQEAAAKLLKIKMKTKTKAD
jgi:hypothetical protein